MISSDCRKNIVSVHGSMGSEFSQTCAQVSGVRRESMNSIRLLGPFLPKPETTGLRIMSVWLARSR